MSDNIAWWFAASDQLPHGDGRRVVLGETLTVEPPLILCQRGLHWCRNPFDALRYASGSLLYQVRPGGQILEPSGEDKGCSTERTALAVRNIAAMLRAFARDEERRVMHLWKPPVIVREWLETGDENKRAAAVAAAWATAWDATWAATWDAARAETKDAANRRFSDAITALFAVQGGEAQS